LVHLHSAFRVVNRLNPTTRGKAFIAVMAHRLKAVPPGGVHEIEPSVVMDLNFSEDMERMIYFRAYEVLPAKLILGRLKPGDVFVDVGANIGFYSLRARRRVGPGGRVIAFEPNPVILRRLRRNLELNEANGRVEVFDVALGDENGTATLYSSAQASHGESSLRDQGWHTVETCSIDVRKLDELAAGANIARIDFLKIDVEGAEKLVFVGAAETIRKCVPSILLEVNSRAAARFGFEPLDATRFLLSLNPRYNLNLVTAHTVKPVMFGWLEQHCPANCNLLLLP